LLRPFALAEMSDRGVNTTPAVKAGAQPFAAIRQTSSGAGSGDLNRRFFKLTHRDIRVKGCGKGGEGLLGVELFGQLPKFGFVSYEEVEWFDTEFLQLPYEAREYDCEGDPVGVTRGDLRLDERSALMGTSEEGTEIVEEEFAVGQSEDVVSVQRL
jgi:hypothetical protein